MLAISKLSVLSIKVTYVKRYESLIAKPILRTRYESYVLPLSSDLPKALKRDSIYNIDVLF